MAQYTQIWKTRPGLLWELEIREWFKQHSKKSKDVVCYFEQGQMLDLIVELYPSSISVDDLEGIEPDSVFLFELKDTDLKSSLFPKVGDGEKDATSLEREFKQHYVPYQADYKYLCYITDGLEGNVLRMLDHVMGMFPDIRRKSFKTKEKAIKRIYSLCKTKPEPLNINEPAYVSIGDFGIARALANLHANFSLAFAQELVESQGITSVKDIVEKLSHSVLMMESQWFYEKDMNILVDEIAWKIHGGEKPESLIRKEQRKSLIKVDLSKDSLLEEKIISESPVTIQRKRIIRIGTKKKEIYTLGETEKMQQQWIDALKTKEDFVFVCGDLLCKTHESIFLMINGLNSIWIPFTVIENAEENILEDGGVWVKKWFIEDVKKNIFEKVIENE